MTPPPGPAAPGEESPCRCSVRHPREPIDAVERIAAAWGITPPALSPRPETAGLALTLLINRNDDPLRAIRRDERCAADRIEIDTALCGAAEAFATALTDVSMSGDGWRGGALASLRALAGRALIVESVSDGTAARLYVKHELLAASVDGWLQRAFTPRAVARAFDALTHYMRRDPAFYHPLALRGQLHERAGDTAWLRSTLTGVAQ